MNKLLKPLALRCGAVVLAVAGLLIEGTHAMANDNARSPLQVAQEMVDAWNTLDLERIIATFAEDGVLHSVMVEPVQGRAALRQHLSGLLSGATRLELRLKNVAVAGNVVFLERLDDFDYKGRHGAVPVVGVMEIGEGKVKVWREYYDRASLLREMGVEAIPKANH
ncbi:MAG: nuclear transport factor 2 family protein [Rhodospirillaceae bacterium]|nr:nuclear transport factor 2 family protein [Rhodospirillaceae bacterium]